MGEHRKPEPKLTQKIVPMSKLEWALFWVGLAGAIACLILGLWLVL